MMNKPNDLPTDGLLGHLSDLRRCLLRCVLALVVLMFALLPVAGDLYQLLARPLLESLPQGANLVSISVIGPFTVQITTAALGAFLISLPYLLYEIWRFVAPGLYAHEKRMILPLVASSTLLFYSGMLFAYFMVFQVVFGFIASIAPDEMLWTPDAHAFFSFAVSIFIAFGAAFETPVAVYLLVRSGAVEAGTLRRGRPWVIVGAFVVAAIVTPPDVISQLLLAIPCWLLFELGLLFAPSPHKSTAQSESKSSAGSAAKSTTQGQKNV